MIGIYKITGPGAKIYIGSSTNIYRRFTQHRSALRQDKHTNVKLQAAWNKYGEAAFTFSVVEVFETADHLIYYEQLWLNILFTSLKESDVYNLNPTAGSILGYRWSDESKQRRQSHIRKLADQRAKTYLLIKDNQEVIITNLDQYCKDNRLNIRGFRRMLAGERKTYRGYRKG